MISDQNISDSRPSTFASVDADVMRALERLAQREQRVGADVAVDDAERPSARSRSDQRRAVGPGTPGRGRPPRALLWLVAVMP